MNECILSIVIPTYGREKSFYRLLTHLMTLLDNPIEIIVCCSSKEYLPKIDHNLIKIFDTSGLSREENYIHGIRNSSGKYVLIAEDDDMISTKIVEKFLRTYYFYSKYDLYIYNGCTFDLQNKIITKACTGLHFTKNIRSKFSSLFGDRFQWGQCITERNLLLNTACYFWHDNKNIVQSDEIITMMICNQIDCFYLDTEILLYIGIGTDNFSWNNSLELEQKELYEKLLEIYVK